MLTILIFILRREKLITNGCQQSDCVCIFNIKKTILHPHTFDTHKTYYIYSSFMLLVFLQFYFQLREAKIFLLPEFPKNHYWNFWQNVEIMFLQKVWPYTIILLFITASESGTTNWQRIIFFVCCCILRIASFFFILSSKMFVYFMFCNFFLFIRLHVLWVMSHIIAYILLNWPMCV